MAQIKVKSLSPTGRVRIHKSKQSYHNRLTDVCRQLGIDVDTYKSQAKFRMYSRMATHPTLGINS